MNQGAPELASSDVKGRNPFKDRRVRRAVYQAIDIDHALHENGYADIPIGMPLPPGINGYDSDLDQHLPYDLAAARALLADAGCPDGFKVRLDSPNGSGDDAFYAALSAMLGEVGIQVERGRPSDAEISARIADRTIDLYVRGFSTSLYDGLDYLETLYRSGGNRNVNASGYSNPELDALLDQIGTEMSTYVRDALIEKAWRIALGDVVHVPISRVVQTWATRDRLELPADPRLRWDFRYARLRDAAAR
jgi:peptide/nickel transport system substrate-binding protein